MMHTMRSTVAARTLCRSVGASVSQREVLATRAPRLIAPSIPRRQHRLFSTSLATSHYHFLLSLAVQGKPGEPEIETSPDGKYLDPSTGKPLPEELQATAKEISQQRREKNSRKIGWPSDTPIGQWRDSLLGEAQAGEDAVMVAQTQSSGDSSPDVAIGVADGVGSWSESGVDPALFSQALMFHASSLFSSQTSATHQDTSPKRLLTQAFKRVQAESAIPAGSSTATILTMESKTGRLRTANLGDSGFIILREGKSDGETSDADAGQGARGKRPLEGTFYRSAPQQYSFNAPYQLSKLPPKMLADWKRQAIEAGQDPDEVSLDAEPAKADEYTCQLKHGDIVVVATDGAWDNVWGKEWVALVKFLKEQHHNVFASHLAKLKEEDPDVMEKDKWLEEKTLANVIAHK